MEIYLFDVHGFVSDHAGEGRPADKLTLDLFPLEHGLTDIWILLDVNVAEVDLVVFFRNETDKMGPR